MGVPTGMIFVRNEHGSHNPREAMTLDDFLAGVDLLYAGCTHLTWLK
jgi:N-carbamoyl-L-amino-acid hydrolase